MTKTKTKAYRKLTRAEAFAICKQLELVINKVPGDEACSYAGGWDDARVAREVIPAYPGNGTTAVGGVRLEVFGPLAVKTDRKANDITALAKRVEDLERDLADLRERLGERKAA